MNRARWFDTMQARRLLQATATRPGDGPADWARDDFRRAIRVVMTTPPDEDNEDGTPEDVLVVIVPPAPGMDCTRPTGRRGRHRGAHRPWWRH